MYHWDFGSIWIYRWLLAQGLLYTVLFTLVCVVLGFAAGVLSGMGRRSKWKCIAWPMHAYVELFRCTPLLVQLIWFYYALPILTGIAMTPSMASVLALSLYGGAFYSEIVRGGINSLDRGQTEAGQVLGMSHWQLMWHIILPQAFKRMLPPLMSQSIMQLKNTSLLSVLAVPDLLYQGQSAAHDSYRPLEIYTIVAICYFVVLFPATLLVRALEIRLARRGR